MVLLFSYGANDPNMLSYHFGREVRTLGARLDGYARIFRGYSTRWGGGVASLRFQVGSSVHGLVCQADEKDLAKMDVVEDVAGAEYARKKIFVAVSEKPEKWLEALCYVSDSEEFNAPSQVYLKAVARTIDAHWSKPNGRKTDWKDIQIQ